MEWGWRRSEVVDLIPPTYDARAIANFILDRADEDGATLTQLSLLKIIYFAHGWYLAEKGHPLVSQPIEAWQYGPVIKVVRDAFKESGKKPIRSRASRLVLKTGEFEYVEPTLADDAAAFVKMIYRSYQHFDGWTLSEITHEKGSPWYNVWNPPVAVGRLGLRIKNEEIRDHFRNVPKRFVMQ